MRNTVQYLMEPLLTQFFLIDAICEGFLAEKQRETIFRELASVFCVPMDELALQYYETADSGVYKKIVDYAGYERLCRTIEFAQTSGQDVDLTPIDRVILAQKRESMQIKSELFQQSRNLTAEIIADTLLTTAMDGNVDAMVTLSFMEYHGICICKDAENARKRLALCAKWNHLFGNLMGIAYDEANQTGYFNTLFTILRSSHQREVFGYICQFKAYDREPVKNPVARIIEKAFALGVVKRNAYDRIFAKVAFSQLISTEDKEKLLLSKKKDAVASLSEIPFDVDRNKKLIFDPEKAGRIPLQRQAELNKLLCSLSPAVNDRAELYRTLLVVSGDDYISEMYVTALKNGFVGGDVIELDAGMLTERDFIGGKENFLLRGLSETKDSHTVFLLKNCDEMGTVELDELMKLLDHGYRRKFNLLDPAVSLDLSDVLIVLFANGSGDPVRKLSEECDVVTTSRISEAEKGTVIDATFRARSKSFGVEQARMDTDCRVYLSGLGTGQIIRLIDSALKKAAFDNQLLITAEILRTLSDQQNLGRNNRAFGYLGGAMHEKY